MPPQEERDANCHWRSKKSPQTKSCNWSCMRLVQDIESKGLSPMYLYKNVFHGQKTMITVTLRKAAQLVSALQNKLNEMEEVEVRASLSVFETNPREAVTSRRQKVMSLLQDQSYLLEAIYDIRNAIGRKNAEVGINELLAKRARLETLEKRIKKALKDASAMRSSGCLTSDDMASLQIVLGEKAKAYKGSDRPFSSSSDRAEVLVLSLAEEAELQHWLEDIRLEKVSFADKLSELNAANRIEISGLSYDILLQHRLIQDDAK